MSEPAPSDPTPVEAQPGEAVVPADEVPEASVHAAIAAELAEARAAVGGPTVLAAAEATNYARAYAEPHPIVEKVAD